MCWVFIRSRVNAIKNAKKKQGRWEDGEDFNYHAKAWLLAMTLARVEGV